MEQADLSIIASVKTIKSPRSLELYIKSNCNIGYDSFCEYFSDILLSHKLSVSDVQRKCFIERSYFYKIIKGNRIPGRDKIFLLALAAHMDLNETQYALMLAKEGVLFEKNKRDMIIAYSLDKKLSVPETNSLLAGHGEEELQ